MKLCVSVWMQVMLAGVLLGSATQELDPEVLLEGYNLCNREFETISYDLENTLQVRSKKYVYSFKHCSNHEKMQWIGGLKCYKKDGTIDQQGSSLIVNIFDDKRFIVLHSYNPELKSKNPPRASIQRSSREKVLQDLNETTSRGAPLKGKLDGSNGQSIYDLLKGAPNLTLHDKVTKIIGHDTYLIEADTKYGVVKAWISPDLDYNCLKWEIIKDQNQFYRDGTTTNDRFTGWTAVYDAEKVEQIDGQYFITKAKFNKIVKNGDIVLADYTYHYNLKNIDLNPDYEAMGAFKIQLPEGTVVTDKDNPGVRYQWIGGKLVTGRMQTLAQGMAEDVVPAAKSERSWAGEDQDISTVSKSNLIKHIQHLTALESRHITHPGNKKAGEYIIQELKKYGYSPNTDSFQAQNMTLHNVISDSSDKKNPVILLSAHFDSTSVVNGKLSSQAPGADDNASGVAALLELARILRKHRIQKNFEFVFFNCEEIGTFGSKHLSNKYRDNHWQIDYMINIDTIGTWKGPLSKTCPVNYVTDKNSMGVIKQLKEQFPYPLQKAKTMWRDDHGNFWNNGFKAIEITEDGCTKHMHKPTDTAEKLHYDNIAKIVHGLYLVLSQ